MPCLAQEISSFCSPFLSNMALRGALLLLILATCAGAQLCGPGATDAFQVRISLKTALGNKAYVWDQNEVYLFQSVIAFAMRSTLNDQSFNASDVEVCNVTKRVSFWFVVRNSSGLPVPGYEVEKAIREKRNRINSAFLLNDNTLEFVQILATLPAPAVSSITVWLVAFGVIFGLVLVGISFLIVSGILQRKAKKKVPMANDNSEENMETVENNPYSDTIVSKGGYANGVYVHDMSDNITPL